MVIHGYVVADAGTGPYAVTTGPDASLWFTETVADRIGRITTDGHVTEFPLPGTRSFPSAITAGADGEMWFTEWGGTASAPSRPTASSRCTTCRHPAPNRTASPSALTERSGRRWRPVPLVRLGSMPVA